MILEKKERKKNNKSNTIRQELSKEELESIPHSC
jgi:hypothetical protein